MLIDRYGYCLFFFFNDTATTEIYTLSLHDALPISAGAGVMCHTNILYMLAAIGLLILLRDGWRALRSKKLYLFATSAFAVMAYEIIYDVIDYSNFRLQIGRAHV